MTEQSPEVIESEKLIAKALNMPLGIEYVSTETSSITTNWGVKWDEPMIARDILQNYRDSNVDNMSTIKVDVNKTTVTITAPAEFNLQRLFFVGSEKTEISIGEFGEGFKVSCLCALRDFNTEIIASSGDHATRIRIGDRVKNTNLKPLIYDYFKIKNRPGSTLVFLNCPGSLAKELKVGLNNFFYPENILLGEKIDNVAKNDDDFMMYESTNQNKGYIFYDNLLRAEIPDIPIILVINKIYKNITNKISQDRDRKAFGDDLRKILYNQFIKSSNSTGHCFILKKSKHIWRTGHPLLSSLASSGLKFSSIHINNIWEKEITESVFGKDYDKKYYCEFKVGHYIDSKMVHMISDFMNQNKEWEEKRLRKLPSYFARFGIQRPDLMQRLIEKYNHEKSLSKNDRPPSMAENNQIELLRQSIEAINDHILKLSKGYKHRIIWTETLLGQLKEKRLHYDADVLLSSSLFTGNFSMAMGVYLHELSHIWGYDSSRKFSDALTGCIINLINKRESLDPFIEKWDLLVQKTLEERNLLGINVNTLTDDINALSKEELISLIENIKPKDVKKALSKISS
jgi:hypothetical protein